MTEHAAGQLFRRGTRVSAAKFVNFFFNVFDALDRVAKMIDALPHAHIRMVGRSSDQEIDRSVGYAERVFVVVIFSFLELKNFVIEFGNPFSSEALIAIWLMCLGCFQPSSL
jgi:hypothetical protein